MYINIIALCFSLLLKIDEPLKTDGIFLPVREASITSRFGARFHPIRKTPSFHQGIDIQGKEGDFVRSVGTGRVIFAGPYRGYGNMIVIRHGEDVTAHYAHCKNMIVAVGDYIVGGQVIGSVGKTGKVTGSHLHFEVRHKGIPVDPLILLKTNEGNKRA